jgi:hypothetical protein
MPSLPFNPADLAPVFPDVAWAVGIAFVLAFVTFRPPQPKAPPSIEDAVTVITDAGES